MNTAIVVGGTSGIGAAYVELVIDDYDQVLVFSRGKSRSELSSDTDRKTKIFEFDFSTGRLPLTHEAYRVLNNKVRTLVISSGSGTMSQASSLFGKFEDSARRNLAPVLNAIESFLDQLEPSDGAIAAVGSIASFGMAEAPMEYVAAKSALNSTIGSLARAIAPIRINLVSPGNVLTTNSVWSSKLQHDAVGLDTYIKSRVPMQRLGTAREIASVLRFLTSESSSFMTGSVVVADGGQLSNR